MPKTKRTRKQWSDLVRAWRRSGLTATEFGSREKIDPRQLRWWAWRIAKDESLSPASISFVELPIALAHEKTSDTLELTWPDGRVLRFPVHMGRVALRAILDTVEGRR